MHPLIEAKLNPSLVHLIFHSTVLGQLSVGKYCALSTRKKVHPSLVPTTMCLSFCALFVFERPCHGDSSLSRLWIDSRIKEDASSSTDPRGRDSRTPLPRKYDDFEIETKGRRIEKRENGEEFFKNSRGKRNPESEFKCISGESPIASSYPSPTIIKYLGRRCGGLH